AGSSGWYDRETFSLTLPSDVTPGTYYLGAMADYNNQVSESNESNNVWNTVKITVTPPMSGFHISLIADASVAANAPAGFTAAMQTAANLLQQVFSDNITINLRYGWGS